MTAKGASLLESYERFRRDAAVLSPNVITKEQVLKSLKSPLTSSRAMMPYPILEKRLRAAGLQILEKEVVGKSDAAHQFGIVAADPTGSKHAYQIFNRIESRQVLDLFIKQLDTDVIVHGSSMESISPEVMALARGYLIDVSRWPA